MDTFALSIQKARTIATDTTVLVNRVAATAHATATTVVAVAVAIVAVAAVATSMVVDVPMATNETGIQRAVRALLATPILRAAAALIAPATLGDVGAPDAKTSCFFIK